jgi:hypothetical protein
MSEWIKKVLFGRQLSYGSDNEAPESFEQAFQQQQEIPQLNVANNITLSGPPPMQQQIQQGPPIISGGASNIISSGYGTGPGSKEMDQAYKISKELVRERMERENPEDVAILDSITESDIICVQGTYDHIHLVLSAIGVPFAHVTPSQLMKMDLKPEQTVYVNCPSNFPAEVARKLSGFVEAGGMLITTDWALKHVLEVGFPGTVKYNGRASGDEVVSVEIVDHEDEILKGFIDQEKDAAPVWWLEGSSYPIQILDKKKVKVLVRSDELKRRYGDDPVIVSFEWGKGMVYHMISHFYLQRSETRTQKQSTNASSYAKAQNMSDTTVAMFEEMELNSPGMNYGVVQSAATSSEFVSRALVKQKKRISGK